VHRWERAAYYPHNLRRGHSGPRLPRKFMSPEPYPGPRIHKKNETTKKYSWKDKRKRKRQTTLERK